VKIKYLSLILLVSLLIGSVNTGCVYFNTFYNAKKDFNRGEKKRLESKGKGRSYQGDYTRSIVRALKVVDNHPNSKWYDDALYVLAVSYYHTEQYRKAERRFREILANYADSKFARDSYLYLAQSKLHQDDIADAMEIFAEVFAGDYDRNFRAQAAMALGSYYFDEGNYTEALGYLKAVRDSLGTSLERKSAQVYIADGWFVQFQFSEALGAYLQILGMEPDLDEKYHAFYRAAICSYRLQRIYDGFDYIQTLLDDEVYFDSTAVLKLTLAEGYEYDDDLEMAEVMYREVTEDETNRIKASMANYQLGLIYQYDYDDLVEAKKLYDKTVELNRSADYGQDALQRSSDIGKLSRFARNLKIDSATTQEMIDNAGHTQYQLAELYYYKLNKPDTAILEMQYLIDTFSTAFEAPKGMIALSQMYRDHRADTAAADSILHEVLIRYSSSDYVVEALEKLDLRGSQADTGYAGWYIRRAENFLIDEENFDSARANYQYVADHFPDSKYYVHSLFALIWITEEYQSPGDSSLILAYTALADSFPNSFWGGESQRRTRAYGSQSDRRQEDETEEDQQQSDQEIDTLIDVDTASDTSSYVDPLLALYIGPNGESIDNLPREVKVQEVKEPFEYPPEAYRSNFQGDVYFQIHLDFSGEVDDYILKIPSGVEEIDREAVEAVSTTKFDPIAIDLERRDEWWVYKFRVSLPKRLQ